MKYFRKTLAFEEKKHYNKAKRFVMMENSSDTACQENRRVVQAGDALCSVRFRSRQRNLRGCIPYHTFERLGEPPAMWVATRSLFVP